MEQISPGGAPAAEPQRGYYNIILYRVCTYIILDYIISYYIIVYHIHIYIYIYHFISPVAEPQRGGRRQRAQDVEVGLFVITIRRRDNSKQS